MHIYKKKVMPEIINRLEQGIKLEGIVIMRSFKLLKDRGRC
jgi:hypothetical protein